MEAWQFPVPHVLNQRRILLPFLSLSCTDDLPVFFLLLCSPFLVVRWKNTLFLGIDACFKLKLKDRGFDDPDLCAGSAYMVNEDSYQKYLAANASAAEPVSPAVVPLIDC